ncbi:hypothetical protein F4703DRAFT_1835115 [Phycomyces blakesleeanus]
MPFTFRTSSPATTSTTRETVHSGEHSMRTGELHDPRSGYLGIAQERTPSPQERVIERIQMLSLSSVDVTPGSVKKVLLILTMCICLAIVLALLMLQPVVRSSDQTPLDTEYFSGGSYTSNYGSTLAHRLWNMPWFGGWEIQIIAIRRNAL